MGMIPKYLLTITIFITISCGRRQQQQVTSTSKNKQADTLATSQITYDTTVTTIHVLVALCDNKYQGIVPVPAAIGNGQDWNNNLYWGCGYGVRTYFINSRQWTLVKKVAVDSSVLERVIFKNNLRNVYLIADAYNGKYIQQCTVDFLKSCAGQKKDTVAVGNITAGIYGNAKLIAYIGHNGLMDFTLDQSFQPADSIRRYAIILACISRNYFNPFLAATKVYPLVWTTGLMCPEAYTLHDAIEHYLNGESVENSRNAAAVAYSKYQKCSLKAAKNLLVTGW